MIKKRKRKKGKRFSKDAFEDKLKVLEEFGFVDRRENLRALKKIYRDEGDFSKVVDFLCSRHEKIQGKKVHRNEKREKRRMKDLKFKDKDEKKVEKKFAKYAAKQVKIESKLEKKEYKKCKKITREALWEHFANPNVQATWEGITDEYLDGEALLHSCKALRQMIYKKKDRKKAEEQLVMIVKEYSKVNQFNVTLIFKEKCKWFEGVEVIDKDENNKFSVVFAKPSFSTPTDLMIAIVQEPAEHSKKLIFVSNSIAVGDLIKNGAKVLNPHKFMQYVATLLGKGKETSTCAWLIEKLSSEITAEESV